MRLTAKGMMLAATLAMSACVVNSHKPSEQPPPASSSHLRAMAALASTGRKPAEVTWGQFVWHRNGLIAVHTESNRLVQCRYTDEPDPTLTYFWIFMGILPIPVPVSHETELACKDPALPESMLTFNFGMTPNLSYDHPTGDLFVNAWYTLAHLPPYADSHSEAFADVVKKARARRGGFVLPESLREYKINAEVAVKSNRYLDAAVAYEAALQIAPEWAKGHFNLGLILGELQYWVDAMDEMQKYLLLVPDAANRRAVLDKIYEWKGKVPEPLRAALKPIAVE